MSTILEQLVDELAQETIALADATGDPELIAEMSKTLAAMSTTTQEAFMAAIRVRLTVNRGRQFLKQKAREAKARRAADEAATD